MTTSATQAPPVTQVATTTTTGATVQPVTIATGNGNSTPAVIIAVSYTHLTLPTKRIV